MYSSTVVHAGERLLLFRHSDVPAPAEGVAVELAAWLADTCAVVPTRIDRLAVGAVVRADARARGLEELFAATVAAHPRWARGGRGAGPASARVYARPLHLVRVATEETSTKWGVAHVVGPKRHGYCTAAVDVQLARDGRAVRVLRDVA